MDRSVEIVYMERSFSQYLQKEDIDFDNIYKLLLDYDKAIKKEEILYILEKDSITFNDFLSLLSEKSDQYLIKIAEKARELTIKRFGKIINFYVPLYLSNECDNKCSYCGFNSERNISRVTLSINEIEEELVKLKDIGFDNILLLTGESRKKADINYINEAVKLAKKYFTYIGLEIYPMEVDEYKTLVKNGANGLTIYQETYNKEMYDKVHISGRKKDYQYRLNTPDRAMQAGFRKVGLGALLGLYDWRYEAIALAIHVDYLRRHYWQQEITLSFPRINPISPNYKIPFFVTDKNFVKMLCILRILYPDIGFLLSTRERPDLRDKLINLCITQISAGSKTTPGGYKLKVESDGQFDVVDKRELKEMLKVVELYGYCPVIKDWDINFKGVGEFV